MHIVRSILIISALIAVPAGAAFAEVKGINGEKCDKSESGVKHDIKGKGPHICDKCVYSTCDTKGKKIENCGIKTDWVNCVADQPPQKKK
jgi:hypothetical protein